MPLFKCSASKAKPKNGIRYITDQNKAAFVSAKNLFEERGFRKFFFWLTPVLLLAQGIMTAILLLR